jgi:DNA modification methylase
VIVHGDCLEVMAGLEPGSVASVVTDPPYGLGFMGKAWDGTAGPGGLGDVPMRRRAETNKVNTGVSRQGGRQRSTDDFAKRQARDARSFQAWCETWAAAAFRVAKPGAHLLSFGGTRTYHRLASAIEDAGWEVRDCLVWGYASGFPKSHNLDGEWDGWGTALKPAWEPIIMARKPLRGTVAANVAAHGTGALNIDGARIGTGGEIVTAGLSDPANRTGIVGRAMQATGGKDRNQAAQIASLERTNEMGRWPANVILTDPIFDGGIVGVIGGGYTSSGQMPAGTLTGGKDDTTILGAFDGGLTARDVPGDSGTYSRFFLVPKSARSEREPLTPEIALELHRARGECDKLRSWAGADLSRNEPTDSTSPRRAISEVIHPATPTDSSSDTSSLGSPLTVLSRPDTRSTTGTATSRTTGSTTSSSSIPSPTSDSTPAANSETASGGSPAQSADGSSLWAPPTGTSVPRGGRSTGDANRATSPRSSSRNVCGRCGKQLPRVTTHPTVKPVDLMRHLIRLVTPPGGIVLDPFLGSGTTGIAAEMEGFDWIGIEQEAEYVAIAQARLEGVQRGFGLSA